MLNGISFGPIKDLGAPDGMLVVAGVAINVLPILMTTINFISGAIYTKGFPLKSKIQLYGMALIFLVFLYQSPAGLVFYWTLNNLFSLCKNIVYKVKSLSFFQQRKKQKKELPIEKKDTWTFALGGCFLALLSGLLIPVTVIHTSPAEFVNILNYSNPLHYVAYSFCLAVGLFVVWFEIFFWLGDGLGRKVMSAGIWVLSGWEIVNYMFFGTKNGTISTLLQYDHALHYSTTEKLVNLGILALIAVVMLLIWWKKRGITYVIFLAAIVAITGMSIMDIKDTNQALVSVKADVERLNQDMPEIPLSTKGKNVLVIMLDRSTGIFIPYLMNERPELVEQFDGFTFYPNATSFGMFTNVGTPALFGGYDYTPENMNRRDDVLLEDKQNEALTLMPRLFDEAGYEVTVCDPPYAGYEWIPDLSIYDDYPDIHAYVTRGRFDEYNGQQETKNENTRRRNFFCYSIMKMAPLFLQEGLYYRGSYNNADAIYSAKHPAGEFDTINAEKIGLPQVIDAHHSAGINLGFTETYFALKNLKYILKVSDDDTNTFMMLANETTHDVMMLQEPEYEPRIRVDNEAYDEEHMDRFTVDGQTIQVQSDEAYMHYQCNMAALIELGELFDTMRERGVYDNTRIIITSDHGWNGDLLPGGRLEDRANMYGYNCLMMVKDFNDEGFTTVDDFMTNADTPTLAMDGLIENPVNPYTGNAVNSDAKNADELHMLGSTDNNIMQNNGTRFKDAQWYGLKNQNALNMSNWRLIDDPSK